MSRQNGEAVMNRVSTIGVLGGMGPEATNRLCALITELTPVKKDQDHIPVITFNNSLIPERVKAVRGESQSPVPEMIRTARVLEQAGADVLLMPCNLAHYFLNDVQREISVPILNMIEETVRFIIAAHPSVRSVGLLASTPTIQNGLYEESFASHARVVLTPDNSLQQANVMEAIYGKRGIKAGYKKRPRALLMEAAHQLITDGAQLIIAGCTEVSLVLEDGRVPVPVIDPLKVLARVAIERAMAGGEIRKG
ncbi:MAG TPA: amino acid racemase [Pyrinomonadaceae bacterium]